MTEFEVFIRECKKQAAVKKLTQTQIADAIGVKQPDVSFLLSGKRKDMKASKMLTLARILDIDLGKVQREAE